MFKTAPGSNVTFVRRDHRKYSDVYDTNELTKQRQTQTERRNLIILGERMGRKP